MQTPLRPSSLPKLTVPQANKQIQPVSSSRESTSPTWLCHHHRDSYPTLGRWGRSWFRWREGDLTWGQNWRWREVASATLWRAERHLTCTQVENLCSVRIKQPLSYLVSLPLRIHWEWLLWQLRKVRAMARRSCLWADTPRLRSSTRVALSNTTIARWSTLSILGSRGCSLRRSHFRKLNQTSCRGRGN